MWPREGPGPRQGQCSTNDHGHQNLLDDVYIEVLFMAPKMGAITAVRNKGFVQNIKHFVFQPERASCTHICHLHVYSIV